MELINRFKLPNITQFLDITTVGSRGDRSYELVLKKMSESKCVIFTTNIGGSINRKGNIKFMRVSLSCVQDQL